MRLELQRGILGSQGRDNTTCRREEGQVSSRRVWYGMVWYGTVWYGKSIVWHGMGWYEYGMVWQASGWMRVGGISGRQARATVGVGVCGACPVCACVHVCRGGVGELTLFLKTGRSHCLAICEAPARARVEGGKSLPRLSHSAPGPRTGAP